MATTTEKIQTLRCQHGEGHDWTRPSQRGKPPNFCPEHKTSTVVQTRRLETKVDQANAEIDALDKEARDNLAKAREAAAKAREERKARQAQDQVKNAREELERIIVTMPDFESTYEQALAKANRTNKLEDWHVADAAQSRIIGMITRRRALQRAAA